MNNWAFDLIRIQWYMKHHSIQSQTIHHIMKLHWISNNKLTHSITEPTTSLSSSSSPSFTFSLPGITRLKDPNLGVNWGVLPLNFVSKVKLKFPDSWIFSRASGQFLRLFGSGAVSGSSFFGSRLPDVVRIGGSWPEPGVSEGVGRRRVEVWSALLVSAIWATEAIVYETTHFSLGGRLSWRLWNYEKLLGHMYVILFFVISLMSIFQLKPSIKNSIFFLIFFSEMRLFNNEDSLFSSKKKKKKRTIHGILYKFN